MDCAICLESISESITLDCKHSFHGGCIGAWLQKSSSCPICRDVGDRSFKRFHNYDPRISQPMFAPDMTTPNWDYREMWDLREPNIHLVATPRPGTLGVLRQVQLFPIPDFDGDDGEVYTGSTYVMGVGNNQEDVWIPYRVRPNVGIYLGGEVHRPTFLQLGDRLPRAREKIRERVLQSRLSNPIDIPQSYVSKEPLPINKAELKLKAEKQEYKERRRSQNKQMHQRR